MAQHFLPPGISSLCELDKSRSYGSEVVIQGIVSPERQGGWPKVNPEYDIHRFNLAAWRLADGPLIKHDLTIYRSVPPKQNWRRAFPTLSERRMRVLLSADRTCAVFDKSLRVIRSDDELQAFAAVLRKPVIIPTKKFGRLVLNRRLCWFEGRGSWNRRLIAVYFPTDANNSIEGALAFADTLWKDQVEWKRRVDEYAVNELLEKVWLEELLTSQEFVRRLELQSIKIANDGELSFWHRDGGMFLGHSIEVRGDFQRGLTSADITG